MAERNILFGENIKNFAGEWVVMCGDKVVAHGKQLLKLEKEINACKSTPTVAKIPKEDTLIFWQ